MVYNFFNVLAISDQANALGDYYKNFINDSNSARQITFKSSSIEVRDHITLGIQLIKNSEGKLYLLDGERMMEFPYEVLFFSQNDVEILLDQNFNQNIIDSFIIRPLIRKSLVENDMMLLHGSSSSFNQGKTIVYNAWAHTGKTNSLLRDIGLGAVMNGDDLCVVDIHGNIYPNLAPINLMYYNLKSLKIKLPITKVMKVQLALLIAKVFRTLKSLTQGKFEYLFGKSQLFFESAANVKTFEYPKPSVEKIKIDEILFLVKSKGHMSMGDISSDQFARHNKACISYEYQRFNELLQFLDFLGYEKIDFKREEELYKQLYVSVHNIKYHLI